MKKNPCRAAGGAVRAECSGAARRLAENLGRDVAAARREGKVIIVGTPKPTMRGCII